jgi:hypothetical protein
MEEARRQRNTENTPAPPQRRNTGNQTCYGGGDYKYIQGAPFL